MKTSLDTHIAALRAAARSPEHAAAAITALCQAAHAHACETLRLLQIAFAALFTRLGVPPPEELSAAGDAAAPGADPVGGEGPADVAAVQRLVAHQSALFTRLLAHANAAAAAGPHTPAVAPPSFAELELPVQHAALLGAAVLPLQRLVAAHLHVGACFPGPELARLLVELDCLLKGAVARARPRSRARRTAVAVFECGKKDCQFECVIQVRRTHKEHKVQMWELCSN